MRPSSRQLARLDVQLRDLADVDGHDPILAPDHASRRRLPR
jgi:hypothetical protein